VRISESLCDSDRACIKACPYGAIHLDPVTQVADKCDFCAHRLEAEMLPACVEVCPADVFAFGDLNDPASAINAFKRKHGKELSVLKPEEKTRPAVQYRGLGSVAPRAMEKKIPKGHNHDPFSYEIDTWAQLQSQFARGPVKKGG